MEKVWKYEKYEKVFFFLEKPIDCARWEQECKKKFVCRKFGLVKSEPGNNDHFCGKEKCKKDEDCTTLDGQKEKYKPPKCEKKRCVYDPISKSSTESKEKI